MKRIIALLAVVAMVITTLVFALPTATAEGLNTANMFNDGVVLQRQMELRIFGKGAVNDKVEVRLYGGTPAIDVTGSAKTKADGTWTITLPAQEAGTGYVMDFYVNNNKTAPAKTVKNVAIGEVWLACGQSNMAFGLNQSQDYDSYVMLQDFERPNIRWTNLQNGGWMWESGHSGVLYWSTVATHFADYLHEELDGVPIGIIQNAVPGVSVHTYLTEEHLNKRPALAPTWDNNNMASQQGWLYEAIETIIPAAVRGMIYYQGETDVNLTNYDQYLVRMMECYRDEFKNPDMAFIQTQLVQWTVSDCGLWPYLRERQQKADDALTNAGMAVGIDLYEGASLHPINKNVISERMAKLAMEICYGSEESGRSPTYDSHTVDGNKVTVTFKNVGDGLEVSGPYAAVKNTPHGFQVAGANGVYKNATSTRIVGKDKVEIVCAEVDNPQYIRYNFMYAPTCNLYTKSGLPVAPFRTDSSSPNMNDASYSTYECLPWPGAEVGEDEAQIAIAPTTFNQTDGNNPNSVITSGDIVISSDKVYTPLFTFNIDVPEGQSINSAYLRLIDKESGETLAGAVNFDVYKVGGFNPEQVNHNKIPTLNKGNKLGTYATTGIMLNHNPIYVKLDGSKVRSGKLSVVLDGTGFTVGNSNSVFEDCMLYVNTVKTPESLELAEPPTKRTYVVGQTFDPAGMQIRAKYADGTDKLVTGYTVEEKELTTRVSSIKVTYGGVTLNVPIDVEKKAINGIELVTAPTKTVYEKGEEFDVTGGTILVTYNDGDSYTTDITANMISGFDGTVAGEQTVTVTAEGFTTTFTVTVNGSAVVIGDADNDGKVSITDALEIFKILAGKIATPGEDTYEFRAGDCNADGGITITDALAIFKHLAGKELLK